MTVNSREKRARRHRLAALAATLCAGGTFALMVFLIIAMDHPLWGRLSVDPGPFRDLEANFVRMHAEQAAPPPVEPLAAPR